VAEKTAPWVVVAARHLGASQGKSCIVVRDGPGFYTTRILAPYLNEAILLLEEGAAVEDVDAAMRDFGFPVGPVALIDEVGIDVGAHVARDLGQAFAHRGHGSSDSLPRLFEAGYHGRKNRRGFYVYPAKGRKRPNPEVYSLIGGKDRKKIAAEEIQSRLASMMVNEAAFCLQEEVVASANDADLGAVLGLGFPPMRGGPCHHVDSVGAAAIVAQLTGLADRHGPRFEPAPMLADMARAGTRFFA
jgi:3-hydroxyacyl-CoA dehydrogenase/enoyl-CoA hydratase/3-hydroxybutyryl-CoA epimerase